MNPTRGFSPRVIVAGVAAAAVLIGAYALGTARASGTPAVYAADTAARATTGAARVTVTGTGTASGTPDQLVADLGVQAHGTSVTGTLDQANQAAGQVIGALRRYGVRIADIQTTGLSVQPSYTPNAGVPDGYDVSETLAAKLGNLRIAGDAINAAVRAGGDATRVDDVSLDLSSTSSLLVSARSAAMADATAKARQYATAVGRTLGPVVSIDEVTPAPLVPMREGASASRSAVPIAPGTQQLSVTLTVVFSLA